MKLKFFPILRKNPIEFVIVMILIIVIVIPLFGHLDTLPLRMWDESRNAVSAYEMLHNKNYLVLHYDGHPDLWNTKPPLLIWFQVAFMKLFGVNELAVRLPSIVAAFLTIASIFIFTKRFFKELWFPVLTAMVLITSVGFIGFHSIRFGDFDSMLTLFTTLSFLSIFAYTETKKGGYLLVFFILLALGVLTKSVSALLFLPGIFFYVLLKKEVIPSLKNWYFYFGILSFLAITFSFYYFRESAAPGYLDAVNNNELGGRYLNSIETHHEPFLFYLDNLVHSRFSFWIALVPLGMVLGLVSKDERIKSLNMFASILIISYFLIISLAGTKLFWYDIPLYPLFSIVVATALHSLLSTLRSSVRWKKNPSKLLLAGILVLIFFFPYRETIEICYKPTETESDKKTYEASYFLKDVIKGKHDFERMDIIYYGVNQHLLFYVNVLNDQGVKTKFVDWNKIQSGDHLLSFADTTHQYLEKNFEIRANPLYGNIIKYDIIKRK